MAMPACAGVADVGADNRDWRVCTDCPARRADATPLVWMPKVCCGDFVNVPMQGTWDVHFSNGTDGYVITYVISCEGFVTRAGRRGVLQGVADTPGSDLNYIGKYLLNNSSRVQAWDFLWTDGLTLFSDHFCSDDPACNRQSQPGSFKFSARGIGVLQPGTSPWCGYGANAGSKGSWPVAPGRYRIKVDGAVN